MTKIKTRILHITSTTLPGGAERIAINIVNRLDRDYFTPFFVTSRYDGPLSHFLSKDVKKICLIRKSSLDIVGYLKFLKYLKENEIQIIHAHEYTVFLAIAAKLALPRVVVIWHNHMSALVKKSNPGFLFRFVGRKADMVLVANQDLKNWTIEKLLVDQNHVMYIPNFVDLNSFERDMDCKCNDYDFGKEGKRVVCVGNIRPEKDQITLLSALNIVKTEIPDVKLILVGKPSDEKYYSILKDMVKKLKLTNHVSFLGLQNNVPAILGNCDIGVLSSRTEAFPMALIEYGFAKLPVVATNVGQCAEILDYGESGILVESQSAESLAISLIGLLESSENRKTYGERFYERVKEKYIDRKIIIQYQNLYNQLVK